MAQPRSINGCNAYDLSTDYLWISPEGRALAGVHHQLILQFLAGKASNSTFTSSELAHIRWQLKQSLPGCYISFGDLEAIAYEFATLEPEARRMLKQALYQSPEQYDTDLSSIVDGVLRVDDPYSVVKAEPEAGEETRDDDTCQQNLALPQTYETFTHPKSSPFTPKDLPSTITNEAEHVSSTRGAQDVFSNAWNDGNSAVTPESQQECSTSINYHSGSETLLDLDCKICEVQMSVSKKESSSKNGMPAVMETTSMTLSIDDDVQITEENARFYAPLYLAALTKMRYGQTSIDFPPKTEEESIPEAMIVESIETSKETTSLPGELSVAAFDHDNTTTTTSLQDPAPGYPVIPKIRRPKPSSYIKHSRGKITIPACEARSFVAWFSDSVQSVPEKIEGYAWYCDRCYEIPSSSGKANTRTQGKYTNKSAIQKHFDKVHGEQWTAVLPESERETGMLIKAADDGPEVANKGPQVYVDTEQGQERRRPDRRSLEGLQTLQTPALMNVGSDYKYRPQMTRRVLFQEELALRETDTNTTAKDGNFDFEDLQRGEENEVPKKVPQDRRHGGKQYAWQNYTTEAPQSLQRHVTFSDQENVRIIEAREEKEPELPANVLKSRTRSGAGSTAK